MRVSANDTERLLAIAAEEARFTSPGQRAERTEEVADALRVAADLRRQAFGKAIVRGAKDKIAREVITTGFTNEVGHRLCLMPYSESQELHRRRTTYKYFFRRGGKGKWTDIPPPRSSAKERDEDRLDVRALIPEHYHTVYVKESRLER